jgi:hypothetical protein
MSRAFTKEDDAGDDIPERPVPAGPNYVTPRGLEMLKAEAEGLVERRKRALAAGDEVGRIDRDLRYLEARIGRAVVVPRGSAGDGGGRDGREEDVPHRGRGRGADGGGPGALVGSPGGGASGRQGGGDCNLGGGGGRIKV